VIHNASFDMAFINWELAAAQKPVIDVAQVIDTLAIAKAKFPMASNSLDALCKRFGVDNSKRAKHGALLDSELLAEVYLELIGGRQTALGLVSSSAVGNPQLQRAEQRGVKARPTALVARLTPAERAAHAALVKALGEKTLWPH
jgi:DNA polymerase III subunit epsilon